MKKIVRLNDSDLSKIIKKVIKEADKDGDVPYKEFGFNDEESYLKDFIEADEYAQELYWEMDEELNDLVRYFFEKVDVGGIISKYQDKFRDRYDRYSDIGSDISNEYIDSLMQYRSKNIDFDEMVAEITLLIFSSMEEKRNP
jgi:hypothetical protein